MHTLLAGPPRAREAETEDRVIGRREWCIAVLCGVGIGVVIVVDSILCYWLFG